MTRHLKIETSTAVVTYNSVSRVALVQTKPGVQIGVQESRANRSAVIQLSNGNKVGCIFFVVDDIVITPEMRADAATAEYNSPYIAMALVSPSMAMRMIGNFYLRVNRPVIPTRFFSSLESAEEWINGQTTDWIKNSHNLPA